MDREAIVFDVADNVATITLNRPDQLNSFNDAMAGDMTWAWETVRDTDDIHCVVLQANGERAFCTGLDMKAAATRGSSRTTRGTASTPVSPSPPRPTTGCGSRS